MLVLDKCEHLIDPCAELVEELLRFSPELRILATSRELLGIAGETAQTVPPLSLPASAEPRDRDGLLLYDAPTSSSSGPRLRCLASLRRVARRPRSRGCAAGSEASRSPSSLRR